MFGSIGPMELMLIFLIILLVFGADRLPELARGLGKGLREFRKAANEVRDELMLDELSLDVDKAIDEGEKLAPQETAEYPPREEYPPAEELSEEEIYGDEKIDEVTGGAVKSHSPSAGESSAEQPAAETPRSREKSPGSKKKSESSARQKNEEI